MAGKDGYKKIKVLIASPSDVSKEREIAEKVMGMTSYPVREKVAR